MPQIEPKDQSLKALAGLHLWHAPMSSCSQRVRIVLAETGRDYESHLVRLEQDDHASPEYQAIHPDGLVPAFVDDGRLFIESIDIIRQIAGDAGNLGASAAPDLLDLADAAQKDLKLLSFEYLFRSRPAPTSQQAGAFQAAHRNDWLKAFRRDFAAGFDPDRLNAAAARIDAGFRTLDNRLADGRAFLAGDGFTIADVAWMPNVHRFDLMGWPFARTPHLQDWFARVRQRPSYRTGLVDWEPDGVPGKFAAYTAERRAAGTDISALPCLRAAT